MTPLIEGSPEPLPKRKITQETCEKWRYLIGEYKGKPAQIATYCDDQGRPVAQKVRLEGKKFLWTGSPKNPGLYGQHLWRDGGKMLVITEGEIDALTVSQLQGNKWPVVSVPNGAASAANDLAKSIEWLEKFETVVLMFDNDDPGREAASACAQLLTPGKVKIAKLPLKDASDMHQAGRGVEVLSAIWEAKEWRPDGVLSIDDVIDAALKPVEWGHPWPWPTLTKLTYGFRSKELYTLGAGVGAGKTDFFTQLIAHCVTTLKHQVGVIYLEQAPVDTARRVAGKVAGKPFHVPDAGWTIDELKAGLEAIKGKVHLYNSFGSTEWEVVKRTIRYMVKGCGAKEIFLDHLTALSAHADDERRYLDGLMAELAGLAQELDITIFAVSHLATPDGTPHEEGGRVLAKEFRGSRAIMQWSNFMLGLERNQQAEEAEERCITTCRVLKDRNTGRAAGATVRLRYDQDTGVLTEVAEDDLYDEQDKPDKEGDY